MNPSLPLHNLITNEIHVLSSELGIHLPLISDWPHPKNDNNIWSWILYNWSLIQKSMNLSLIQDNADIIEDLPLWHCHLTGNQSPPNKSWIDKGIDRLEDIINERGQARSLISFNRTFKVNASLPLYSSIIYSIPQHWWKTTLTPPILNIGDWIQQRHNPLAVGKILQLDPKESSFIIHL